MTEKRFINDIDNGKLIDTKGELSTIYYSDAIDFYELWEFLNKLNDENEQLKKLIKELEKQIHLIHMSSMFSTVKSFRGDVSKRYKYSEETDTIYDTANTYGQYNKVLDKKEVVMLLNEYETLLRGDME